MNVRLLDVSANQRPEKMRYGDWRALGFAGAVRRIAVGLTLDPTADEHRRLQRDAGYLTGGYSALHEAAPMPAQCQLFIDHLLPDDELPAWADVERAGLTWRMVVAWLDWWDGHCGGRELWCYLNESVLRRMGVQRADRARLARYGLVVSGYPFDAAVGPQPLDSDSIALRSNPPAASRVAPLIPAPWDHYDAWQHTGAGRLPGYDGNLDLSVYAGSEAELRARFETLGEHMTKLCTHIIGGSQDARAYTAATHARFVKLVDDWGAATQYHALGCTVIGRHVFGDEVQPDNADQQAGDPAGRAAHLYATRYGVDVRLNPDVDAWEGPNEPVCQTAAGMAWYGLFEAERVRLLRADGKRAVIGNFSVGQPEPGLWPQFFPAITALAEPGGWLGLHEYSEPCRGFDTWYMGRFTRAPKEVKKLITECGTDGIPATADCPAGRSWRTQFGGDAAAYAAFLHDYDSRLARYPDVDAAFIFTSGRGWPDHNMDGAGVLSHLAELAGSPPLPPNEEIPMTEDELQAIHVHASAIDAIAQKYLTPAPPPWYETLTPPYVVKAHNPCGLYSAPGGALLRTLTDGRSMDVFERSGEWLRVTQAPTTIYWTKVAEVSPA